MMRFVWLRTNGRLHAEKQAADAPSGCRHGHVVAEHDISPAEATLSIAELAARYPVPDLITEGGGP